MEISQVEAIKRVKEILSEHFEASVVIVNVEIGDKQESTRTFWHGGFALARGMLELSREELQMQKTKAAITLSKVIRRD